MSLTDEDTRVTIEVLANDSDPDGDLEPASLQIVLQGSMGTASVTAAFGQADPVVTYVPDADEFGNDTFHYQVCDLAGHCSTGSVFVTVKSVNDSPVAVGDTASTNAGEPVDIAVLDNDYDVDGDGLAIDSYDATSDAGGSVSCTIWCVYTPPSNFSGDDFFSYTATDGLGGTDVATVSIRVTSVDLTWYLRSLGPGDASSTPKLPLAVAAGPTNGALPNYDIDRDDADGLLLREAASGLSQQLAETDPSKFQLWSYTMPAATRLSGNARVTLYGAMRNMAADLNGRVRVFLLDCSSTTSAGADCSTIAVGTVTRRPWSNAPDTWVGFTAFMGDVDYSVSAGRAVVLKLVVGGAESEDDMWFAYDAGGFVSTLRILAAAADAPSASGTQRLGLQ